MVFLTTKKALMGAGRSLAMEVNGRFFEKEVVTLIQMPVTFQGYTWVKAAGTWAMFIICFEVLNESGECACPRSGSMLRLLGGSSHLCALKCLGCSTAPVSSLHLTILSRSPPALSPPEQQTVIYSVQFTRIEKKLWNKLRK